MKNQTILDRLRSFITVNGGNANGLKTIEDAVKRLNSIPGGGGGGGSAELELVGKYAFSVDGNFGNVTLSQPVADVPLQLAEGVTLPDFDFFTLHSISDGTYSTHVNYIGFEASNDLTEVRMTFAKSSSYGAESVSGPNINFDLWKLSGSGGGGGGGSNSGMKVMPFPWDDDTQYIEASAVDALVADLPDAFEYDVTQYGATNKLRLFFALTVNRGAGIGYNFGSFVSAASNYGIAIYPEYAIQYGDMSGTPNVFNYNASTNRYERQS